MNRRSEKLDKYLNKRVEITFIDGSIKNGVLSWNEYRESLRLIPQWYYLEFSDGTHLSFRKSHVKSIKDGGSKWLRNTNKELLLKAIETNGHALKCTSEELKADKEVVLKAVRQDGWALEYASKELQKKSIKRITRIYKWYYYQKSNRYT